jgi:hypothetical protein
MGQPQELAGRTGSYIGPPLTAAAGWAIGGPIGGSIGWLVGSWLFGAKPRDDQQVFDPGAEEMPRPNQALRGTTIPVGFGTNRWPSNVVWMKNWTVVRHESRESAGGGKGGGSGMGGKGGALGPTNVSYNYKVDILFHHGIAPEPVSLFGGWLGGQRLNNSTIAAISGLTSGQRFMFQSAVTRSKNAALSFTDAFFGDASPSDDDNALAWDYFETQEGLGCRWPYTTYTGFQQLDLGGSAAIPQFAPEIGPGGAEITQSGDFLGLSSGAVTDVETGNAMARSANGTRFIVAGQRVIRVSDGVTIATIDDATFDADATTAGLDPTSAYTFTGGTSLGFAISNQPYVVFHNYNIIGGSRTQHAWVVYRVNDNSTLTPLGGYHGRHNSDLVVEKWLAAALGGNQTLTDPVITVLAHRVGAAVLISYITLPALSAMIAGAVIEDTASAVEARQVSLTASLGNNFGVHQSKRTYGGFGWIMPSATLDLLGAVTYAPYWYFYVGRADIQEHIDDPAAGDANTYIAGKTGTYPNGFIARIALDGSTTPEIVNDSFTSSFDGVASVPFSDACIQRDGTTINYEAEYDPNPSCCKLTSGAASGAYLVIFTKRFEGVTDLSPSGDYIKVRAYVCNPFSGKCVEYAFEEGVTYDSVVDAGQGGGGLAGYDSQSAIVYFNEDTFELVQHRHALYDPGQQHVLATFGELGISSGGDVTPAYIIYQILTHPVFRAFNYDADDIDQDSYAEAVQRNVAEGILVSTIWMREEDALKVIDLCLALYGGFLTESNGKVKFGFASSTNNPLEDRVIDNDHLVQDDPDNPKPPVRIQFGSRQDTYNKVKVNFLNRSLEYKQDFVQVGDEVDQDLHGIRAHEFPPQFVMSKDTATKLAIRTLWSNLYNRATFNFNLGWKDADIEPGTVMTLVDSFDEYLRSGKTVRMIGFKEERRGVFANVRDRGKQQSSLRSRRTAF